MFATRAQVEFALGNAGSTATIRNSGKSWDTCRKHHSICICNLPLAVLRPHAQLTLGRKVKGC